MSIRSATSARSRKRRASSSPLTVGEPEVEDHERGPELLVGVERRGAFARVMAAHADRLEILRHEAGDAGIVFHDQNDRSHGERSLAPTCGKSVAV